MALLQRENGGVDLKLDVASLKGQGSVDVGIAEMAFAGESAPVLRLHQNEDVEIREGTQLHRRFHQNFGKGNFQILKLIYQPEQIVCRRHCAQLIRVHPGVLLLRVDLPPYTGRGVD